MEQGNQEPGRGRTSAPVVVGLLAAAVLLVVVTLIVVRHRPAVRADAAAPVPPVTAPQTPAPLPAVAPPPPDAVAPRPDTARRADKVPEPLTVNLTSTGGGRHIKVGSGVTFTAFTALAPGRSATLTIFYRLNRGRKTMVSFVQGTLCSTTWVAPAPGLYQFTASALGDRRQAAVSRAVEITVDAPAPPPALRVAVAPPPKPKAAPIAKRAVVKQGVVKRAAVKPPAVAGPAARPPVYHVFAAHFARARNADDLAAALGRNGYRATVRRMNDRQGKAIYVVETGTYRQPAEVYAAVNGLLQSGYPADFYTGK